MNNDLISREALKEALNYMYDCAYIDRKSKEGIVSDVIDEIDNAPTVKGYENVIVGGMNNPYNAGYMDGYRAGLEERPQGRWIPVSERSPKEEDYHECYGLPDGCVWWQLDNGIIGLGWFYESTKVWSDTNDHRIEENGRKVIAWQPLPKPYERSEGE